MAYPDFPWSALAIGFLNYAFGSLAPSRNPTP
jgi:hypothetical protein